MAAGRAPAHLLDADDIIPRDIRFGIAENATRNWFGGDFHKTAMIDGLSIFLPEGERFFIRALKHHASAVADGDLLREINGYAIQEAYHTREHEEYNRTLKALGFDVDEMEKPIRFVLRNLKSPIRRLAATCAIEHITATLSTVTLRHPELFADAAPAYRRLWMWHALEEIEHKAVALDVYNKATAGQSALSRYALRILVMNSTAIGFLTLFLRNVRIYARNAGVKTGVRFWLRFARVLLVDPGYWRRSVLTFLTYYRPGYDPRTAEDRVLVEKGRAWLAAELPLMAGGTAEGATT